VGPLRDDALELETAGFLEVRRPAAEHVLGKAQAGGRRAQQRGERLLALQQRGIAQVAAVQKEQIEQVVGQLGRAALVQRVLKRLETRAPLRVQRDDLAVEERLLDLERLEGGRGPAKARRPVVASPREEASPAALKAAQQPVAVEFELME